MRRFFEADLESFPPGHFRGKRVLELGAGTGAVSICLALLGADVVASDDGALLPLLRRNFALNGCDGERCCAALRWGDDAALFDATRRFDYIVLCDCVAPLYAAGYPALLDTVARRLADDGVLLVAYELRDARDREFFELLRARGFAIERVRNTRLHDDFQSDDIRLFECRRAVADADGADDGNGARQTDAAATSTRH